MGAFSSGVASGRVALGDGGRSPPWRPFCLSLLAIFLETVLEQVSDRLCLPHFWIKLNQHPPRQRIGRYPLDTRMSGQRQLYRVLQRFRMLEPWQSKACSSPDCGMNNRNLLHPRSLPMTSLPRFAHDARFPGNAIYCQCRTFRSSPEKTRQQLQ